VFAVQYVGVTEVENDIWLVSFMDYDLGFFDKEVDRVELAGENPFAPKVLPMCPEWTKGGWSGREDSNLRPYGPELITNNARLCFSMVYGHAGIWLFIVF